MQADLSLAAALMGGTRAMRDAGEAYLPKWPNEDADSYKTRLATSVLFPAFKRTVVTLAGKPFSKPITIGEDVPPQLADYCQDIDLEGRNLHTFGQDLMKCALAQGICGILVDYPVKPENVKTQADERTAGLRPYWVHIKPEQILGWVSARVAGKWAILQLRLMECVEESAGDFATKEVKQVRVLEPGKWATYRPDPKKPENWILHDQGTTTLGYVPFVPVYGDREGFMIGKSPLLEVGHMNVEHWQSASDQRNILHVARVPILTVIGIDPDDNTFKLTVGASAAVKLPVGGDMKFVEHSGKAIEAGQTDLDKLEERMRQAGAELLVIKPIAVTATEKNIDNSVGMCALQSIASGLQDNLNSALQITADWVSLPEGGHVTLFDDYASHNLTDASAQLLVTAQQAGLLSKATTINELKRRGTLSAEVDADEEAEAIGGEGPALGTITE